ncbi:hypothetical protein FQA39_LY00543 [Lamprigera yunnana]|nr:hypothetical protein FQA39_LY00543 [Lamprigera yunnana]
MNVTGDPTKGNESTFPFGCPYPSTSVDFPRFNNQAAILNPLFLNVAETPPIPQFYQPNGFPVFNSQNTDNTSINYSIPSTSSNNGFPFSAQIPVSIDCSVNVPNSYLSHNVNAFLSNQFNKCDEYKLNNFVTPNNYPSQSFMGSFGCKRKTDSSSMIPTKQHITEERMAEHMSRLHISSQTASTQESLSNREQRLYMCEEMQRLQTESIIPVQILEKVYRPCTAIVPWRPPVVPPIVKENNNNEEEPDNNVIDTMEMDSLSSCD